MENEERIRQLKSELFILTVRRSLRPSIQDNARMWQIMAELYQLTNDEMFNLKSK
jgi:hypothetical protein